MPHLDYVHTNNIWWILQTKELSTNQTAHVPYHFPSNFVGALLSKTLYLYSSSYLPNMQYLSLFIIRLTRCTNFSNLFLEWNSTCFGQFLRPSSGIYHCTNSNGICLTGLLTACEQDPDGTAVPSWSCSKAAYKPVWHITLLCVRWETPDDGQRNCPKHVEFHSKIKIW